MTRSSDEAQRLAELSSCRVYVDKLTAGVGQQIAAVVRSITDPPIESGWDSGQIVRALTGTELIVLDTWTDGDNPVIHGECDRRAEQAAWLLHRLTDIGI